MYINHVPEASISLLLHLTDHFLNFSGSAEKIFDIPGFYRLQAVHVAIRQLLVIENAMVQLKDKKLIESYYFDTVLLLVGLSEMSDGIGGLPALRL